MYPYVRYGLHPEHIRPRGRTFWRRYPAQIDSSLSRTVLAAFLFIAAVAFIDPYYVFHASMLSCFVIGVTADLDPLEDLFFGRQYYPDRHRYDRYY